jgi:hypothetical protein
MRRLAIAVVVGALTIACGPGRTPAGQAALVALGAERGLDPVSQPFNAAADDDRVILLLSPT